MPHLFSVPPPRLAPGVLYHNENAVTSVLFLIPALQPNMHAIYYVILCILAATSFGWWGFQMDTAQIFDVSCVASLASYYAVSYYLPHETNVIVAVIFGTTAYLEISRYRLVNQALIIGLLMGAVIHGVAQWNFLSATLLVLGLLCKWLDIAGFLKFGTAFFHLFASISLLSFTPVYHSPSAWSHHLQAQP